MQNRAASGRDGVPLEPGRWLWSALVLGLLLIVPSLGIAISVPRLSMVSAAPLPYTVGELTCAEVLEEPHRVDPAGFLVRGHHAPVDPSHAEIVCEDGARLLVESPTNLAADGAFEVAPRGGSFVVTTAYFGGSSTRRGRSPRTRASEHHAVGVILGVLGVFALLVFWGTRPLDTLGDLAPAAPAEAEVLSVPTDDHVLVRGTALRGRRIAAGPDREPAVRPDADAGYLHVPGADPDYRSAGGGLITLVGPGRVNGLRVGRGERAVVLHGDRVQLPGARPFTVELPTPGLVLRYLWAGGRVCLAGRVRARRTYWTVLPAAALGALGVALLHADLAYGLPLGAAALALTALAARLIPPRMTARVLTEVPLEDVARGDKTIHLADRREDGVRVAIDADHVAWLGALGRFTDDGRRALRAALARELEVLGTLSDAARR